LFRWHWLILILQARQQRELEEAEREEERAARAAHELEEQIQADAMRQAMAKEQQYKTRKRANSETTEVPQMFDVDTPTERFHDMEMNGVKFNSVKLFHPRSGKPLCALISTHLMIFPACLGLMYMAEPVVDDITSVTPLELLVISFEAHYYITSQGKKKLNQVEQEIKNLINIRHPKLLSIYAVKLNFPPHGSPLLMVLMEQSPALTLHDVLEDSDSLREDRASVRSQSIMSNAA